MKSRVLFVSGRPDDALQISHMLDNTPVAVDHAESLQRARAQLRQDEYDVILTEAALPDGNWVDALHLARDYHKDVEVIVTDPHADARLWSQVLNLGAYDLIAQPFYAPEVCRILQNACGRHTAQYAPLAAV